MVRSGKGNDSTEPETSEPVMPSAFMRELRPEYYSDTADRTTIVLDRPTLEYQLDTITARNETHDFEIFSRKLCERTICPNLMPVSGPEGGGDSKVDTESIPVSEEIATLSYVGEANHGSENWAFAFSAKKTWTKKVRADVAGIVATHRDYKRIYCVTSRYARARDRSRLEDELTKKYKIPIKILDRSWIVEEIIDRERKDLALHYLRVGREVASPRVGPTDYSRKQRLDDLELKLGNSQAYAGLKLERAADALIAAKLSRAIERPRVETDGRFQRAARLADIGGSFRQRLMARYEYLWTSFWWFDDIALLNESYETFEALAVQSDHAANLEFLSNLLQAVFNCVVHRHLTEAEAQLEARAARLRVILSKLADDALRPNNALAARVSLLVLDVNQAARAQNRQALSALWPQISQLLDNAKGLGEFDAEGLIKMVEVFGMIAGADPAYAAVVDQLAEFVAKRKSEGEGALVLLKRAQQLELEQHFEIIRLLGRAVTGLTKKEYTGHFVEAMQLLGLAYRSAGLLWAARSSMVTALTSSFIEADEDGQPPAHVVGTLGAWCHIALELWHLSDVFEAARLLRGCIESLPLDEASKERAKNRYRELDAHLASRIVALPEIDLEQMVALPDVLSGLDLELSATALLYVLGYEAELRAEGTFPPTDSPEKVAELFTELASQGRDAYSHRRPILNHGAAEILHVRVLGMQVRIGHNGTEASTAVAEAIAGAVECIFTTALQHEINPHTESFAIAVEENDAISQPQVKVDAKTLSAKMTWPAGKEPSLISERKAFGSALLEIAAMVLATTCMIRNSSETLRKLMDDDVVVDRHNMIMNNGNSRHRLTGHAVPRLSEWIALSQKSYPLRVSRPSVQLRARATQPETPRTPVKTIVGKPPEFGVRDHQDTQIRSVIDVHLWDAAGWTGVAYEYRLGWPPFVALMFTNRDAGRQIFQRWRDRFGREDKDEEIHFAIVRAIDPDHAHHYRPLITSKWSIDDLEEQKLSLTVGRMLTVPANSSQNLEGALAAYHKIGAFVLVPASINGGTPMLHHDLGILKRSWVIKNAADVAAHEPEAMAVRRQAS